VVVAMILSRVYSLCPVPPHSRSMLSIPSILCKNVMSMVYTERDLTN
jgi:hypothetical protein